MTKIEKEALKRFMKGCARVPLDDLMDIARTTGGEFKTFSVEDCKALLRAFDHVKKELL